MKTPSYQSINYGLRPAKQIERKMLADSFRRLSEIQPVHTYQYIGFGSVYFTDFILLHRTLGITEMVSIEHHEEDEARFRFNLPYRCITLEIGKSTTILPRLNWRKRSILWLDYDGTLDTSVLADINIFCNSAISGSLLIVSVNAHPGNKETNEPQDDSKKSKGRLEILKERLGANKVPSNITEKSLRLWGTADAYRQILFNEISESISIRNGQLLSSERLQYQQLFNFRYRDGAQMLTTGGIIFNEADSKSVERCRFSDVEYCKNKDEAFTIEIPNLTLRELRYIDKQLPVTDIMDINLEGIPSKQVESYMKMYRHFANFGEIDI